MQLHPSIPGPRVKKIRLQRTKNLGPFMLFPFISYIGNNRNPLITDKTNYSLDTRYCGVQLYLMGSEFNFVPMVYFDRQKLARTLTESFGETSFSPRSSCLRRFLSHTQSRFSSCSRSIYHFTTINQYQHHFSFSFLFFSFLLATMVCPGA